ncbi:tellurite resistance protein TerC [Saccharopolyspora erythraea NRRL 2338]|uniref:Integral membrane protein TerC n=3 Tax=Saccharopolyspora erythraea TaxID=1836 RepID=A4FKR0_SACEN|nr:tellurium resistance protein TerC [Saccharopolyspora erythraea D]PFG98273.1 tellurite resistance protein TerC [Saccharopolyspora erythraea NRRL 2338]CAM04635.1 integral membrane protein TerC [Saccharopolyspora erythraea NRRL 2338]
MGADMVLAQNVKPVAVDTMHVHWWVWAATLGGLAVLLILDLVIVDRKPHEVTTKEAAKWVCFYVGCAILFGIGVWIFGDAHFAIEYFTGYITEYSLSVDNLFIFMVIMSSFAVPSIHQHRVLLIGILLALVMRGVFIAVGAALIAKFVWVFFLFGGFLLWTAIGMVRKKDEEEEYKENAVVRWVRKIYPVTEDYDGTKMSKKIDGKRYLTPMFVVIVAIGSADLLFAVDSIPAIFGITQDPFLVFAANAFALMGLRQLYFLLGGLVDKLVYLSVGLAVILGFIGFKLILHALHEYHLVPEWLEINNWMSLGVIVVVLAITTWASLAKSKKDEVEAQQSESGRA